MTRQRPAVPHDWPDEWVPTTAAHIWDFAIGKTPKEAGEFTLPSGVFIDPVWRPASEARHANADALFIWRPTPEDKVLMTVDESVAKYLKDYYDDYEAEGEARGYWSQVRDAAKEGLELLGQARRVEED